MTEPTAQQHQAGQPVQMIPTSIPVGPVPTAWAFDVMPAPGGQQLVCLRIQTPSGVNIYPLAPGDAIAVADQLRSAGTRAKLGIILPA